MVGYNVVKVDHHGDELGRYAVLIGVSVLDVLIEGSELGFVWILKLGIELREMAGVGVHGLWMVKT